MWAGCCPSSRQALSCFLALAHARVPTRARCAALPGSAAGAETSGRVTHTHATTTHPVSLAEQKDVSITVVDTMDHLLGAFDRELSEYTANHFKREGINVQLGTM